MAEAVDLSAQFASLADTPTDSINKPPPRKSMPTTTRSSSSRMLSSASSSCRSSSQRKLNIKRTKSSDGAESGLKGKDLRKLRHHSGYSTGSHSTATTSSASCSSSSNLN